MEREIYKDDFNGTIEAKGAKVVEFDEGTYLFYEDKIYKLKLGKDNYAQLTTMFISDDKINLDTITICKWEILFMTKNCIWSFDGYNSEKITLEKVYEFREKEYKNKMTFKTEKAK